MLRHMISFHFLAITVALTTLSAATSTPHPPATTDQPNILFVFADDFAYDCAGYTGNSVIKTPNIDKLAQRSTSFTHCYNMGSWSPAVCLASRAMLKSPISMNN